MAQAELDFTIPVELPNILKEFTKALLRARPDNIVQWAADYFGELAKSQPEDVGFGLGADFSDVTAVPMISEQELRMMWTELGSSDVVSFSQLRYFWIQNGLAQIELERLWMLGEFGTETVKLSHFVTLATSTLTQSLNDSLSMAVRIMSETEESGMDFKEFESAFEFITKLDPDIAAHTRQNMLDAFQTKQTPSGFIHWSSISEIANDAS